VIRRRAAGESGPDFEPEAAACPPWQGSRDAVPTTQTQGAAHYAGFQAPIRVGVLINGDVYGYGISEFLRALLPAIDRGRVTVVGLFLSSGQEKAVLAPLCDEVCDLHVGPVIPLTETGRSRYYLPNLWRKGTRFLKAIIRTAMAVRQRRLDVLHVHLFPLHLVAGLAARMARRPCIWHWHGPFQQGGLARAAARFGFRCLATRIACISRFVLETLPESAQAKARVVYNGVQTLEIAGGQQHGVLRRRIAVLEGTPLVGLFGSIMERKGQEYFIRAAAQVVKSFPTVRFVVVGGENEVCRLRYGFEARYRRLVAELGLERTVLFAGHLAEASLLMGDCDIICMPTVPMGRDSGEGFGLVMAEAMAAGVPVVATNCGAPPEVIEDGVSGLLVPPRDSGALAKAIGFLLEDEGRRKAFGDAARRRVQEHFDVCHTAEALEEVYREVARGR